MASYRASALQGFFNFPAGLGGGARDYPVYSCMIPAEQIDLMANVPRFSSTISHQALSSKLKGAPGAPPSGDWQRPMVSGKLELIVRAANKDVPNERVFPNPVLIGVNYTEIGRGNGATFRITPVQAGEAGIQHCTLKMDYDDTQDIDAETGKPLVVIDGQHRVIGLARSDQKGQLIPCVILADPNLFSMSVLARIFSEVSTTATKLDDMHQYWMEFAFSMGKHFTDGSRNVDQWRDAMKTTILLNSEDNFDDGLGGTRTNNLCGSIKFNPHPSAPIATYQHISYSSDELTKLIKTNYYSNSPATRLSGQDLMTCIARAFSTLENEDTKSAARRGGSKLFDITTPDSSVQIGVGVMIGILHFISKHPNPLALSVNDWRDLWRNANLHQFDWGLSHTDIGGTLGSGEAGKKPARYVFSTMIRKALEGYAPFTSGGGHTNLRDHLRGNRSIITMVSKFDPTVAGGAGNDETVRLRPTSGNPALIPIDMQASRPVPLGAQDRHMLKFITSDNCLKVGHDYAETGAHRANTEQRKILMKAFNKSGVNLDGILPRGRYDFVINTQSYSQGTNKKSLIRVIY